MNKIVATNHGIVRAGERLFSHKFKGSTDKDRVNNDKEKSEMLEKFLIKSVIPAKGKLMGNIIYRAVIEGFDNYRAVVETSNIDSSIHKIITIKEIR